MGQAITPWWTPVLILLVLFTIVFLCGMKPRE